VQRVVRVDRPGIFLRDFKRRERDEPVGAGRLELDAGLDLVARRRFERPAGEVAADGRLERREYDAYGAKPLSNR
jgi:hypothetical protein